MTARRLSWYSPVRQAEVREAPRDEGVAYAGGSKHSSLFRRLGEVLPVLLASTSPTHDRQAAAESTRLIPSTLHG